ncbi:MAG: helix-turn-helix domain-containing protein [Bacteriovoracia bacterium]
MAERDSLTSGEKKLLKVFGTRVRAIREQQKKSVYDVTGDDMPIKTRQHWQMIEAGKKNIQLTTISKIAESLEISSGELFK